MTVGPGMTWTGHAGTANWSNPDNWDLNRAPMTGDLVVISTPDGTPLTTDDDITGLTVNALQLAGPVTIDGKPLTIDAGISSSGDETATVQNDLTLTAGQHRMQSDTLLNLVGVISGDGGMTVSTAATGFVVLGATANTYTGQTVIDAGANLEVTGDGGLGAAGTGQGTFVAGTLCIGPGATIAEPIVAQGGAVASCDSEQDLETTPTADSNDGDTPQDVATLTGPVDDERGVSFGPFTCYLPNSADDSPLVDFGVGIDMEIDGAITGPAGVHAGCMVDDGGRSGTVTFGGAAANTYAGSTTLNYSTLVLDKSNGVTALPGDLGDGDEGHLVLAADDQVAHSANVDVDTFDLGQHEATVTGLSAFTLATTVASDGTAGVVHVTGDAHVGGALRPVAAITVASDPPVGTSMVLLDKQSSGAIGDCSDGLASGGDAVTSYRAHCAGGDGNDLSVDTIWTSTVSLGTDPPNGAVTGSPVIVTATVHAPSGGATPTGQASLFACSARACDPYSGTVTTVGTVTLDASGVATFNEPDTGFLGSGRWLKVRYLGDGSHAPATSELIHYPTWAAPPSGSTVPGAPTWSDGDSRFCDPGTACLSWNAPTVTGGTDIVGYRITVTPQGGTSRAIDTNTSSRPTDTFFDVRGLAASTAYTFIVAAINHSGIGPASAPLTLTSPPPGTPPGMPTHVTGTAGPGQVNVTWSAPDDDGGQPILDYEVSVYDDSDNDVEDVDTVDATTNLTVTGLTSGTPYTFTVTAQNVLGYGDESDSTAPIAAEPLAGGVTVPGAPTAVTATGGPGQATVTWTAPADTGGMAITNDQITIYQGGDLWDTVVTSSDATTATVTGLPTGDYTFAVAAANGAGPGTASAPTGVVTITAPGTGGSAHAPAAPTGVTATPGPGQAFVTWTAPGSDGQSGGQPISHYLVTPYVGGTAQAPVATAGPVTSLTVAGLLTGVPYTFTVTAVNPVGVSTESAKTAPVTPTQAAPTTGVPAAPTGLTSTVDGRTVTLTWTAPNDGGSPITGYLVRESRYVVADFGDWRPADVSYGPSEGWMVPANQTSDTITTDTITSPWTVGDYRFTVTALNSVGPGPESNLVHAAAVWQAPAGTVTVGPGDPLPPCSSVPPTTPCAPDSGPGDRSNNAGSTTTLNGSGFAPGETVDAGLHSDPINLGTFTADPDGSVHAAVSLPIDAPTGAHTITLTGATTGHVTTIPITLTQALTVSDVTSSSMTVSWPEPATGGITGYTVQVDGTTAASPDGTATSVGLTGLAAGTDHRILVTAKDDDGPLGSLGIVAATRPLTVTGVTFTAPNALGGQLTYGSTATIGLSGNAGASATATVTGTATDGTATSVTVPLAGSPSGHYQGTLTLDTSLATITSVVGTLSDGTNTADQAATGLPQTQSGALALDIAAAGPPVTGTKLELVNSAADVDHVQPVGLPATLQVPVATGTWTAKVLGKDGTVLAEQSGIAVQAATVSAVSLHPAAATKAATVLRIDKIRSFADVVRLLEGRYRLTVHLTTADGTPVPGQTVVVDTWFQGRLCTAATDDNGVASCAVPRRFAGEVLLGLVWASFAGSAGYLQSTGGRPRPRHIR